MSEMTAAELREKELLWNPDAALPLYLAVVEGKTAALFAAAAQGAAALANAPVSVQQALAHCGRAFGSAFQVQDDVRDYQLAPEASGKDSLKDIREGLVTLPLILALRHDPLRAAPIRRYLLSRGQARLNVPLVRRLVTESGALDRGTRFARQLALRGLRGLEGAVPSGAVREVVATALHWVTPGPEPWSMSRRDRADSAGPRESGDYPPSRKPRRRAFSLCSR
jgi:geranylgeranyl pyrophosphate synthase